MIMAGKRNDHSKMLSYRLGQDSEMSQRLCQAISDGELELVRMYIERGVDVRQSCIFYPLELACSGGHEEIMEELLKAGAHPNQVIGRRSQPAMLIAAEKCVLTLSMLRCLISHGADVDFRDVNGQTILHYLARDQLSDTRDDLLSAVKCVLENGASFYAPDRSGHTPLYWACTYGNIDLIKLFIAEGADVYSDNGRKTMLTGAIKNCNFDLFDLLLNAGANKHLTPDALIHPCLRNRHAVIVKILYNCDVDINITLDQFEGMAILHYACDDRDITSETVRLLLDHGADVRAVSDTGDTVLHYAVNHCDCKKIRQLLSYNLTLNIKNNKNQTPLAKLTQDLINRYSQSRQQAYDHRLFYAWHQADVLAFTMLVTAGAKVTTDVEQNLNQFHIKLPEAQIPDYEIRSTRSLKEMCRFVILRTIPVPVDVSLYKLPIPKLLQEYLNFPEFDPVVDGYLNIIATTIDYADDYDYDDDDYDYDEASIGLQGLSVF